MEYTASLPATRTLVRRITSRVDSGILSAWTLAFALVFYLAMRGGGYDAVVRGEVGVAVWWIVLLAAVAGFLPTRIGRAGWVAVALMAGFAAWTALAIGWSQSAESSVAELGREAAYLGFLVLAVSLQGRAAARATVNGLACAIGSVMVLAVLSRLHPEWFSANAGLELLGASAGRRLSYPLNYWNGLAAFAAIGVPLLLSIAISARTAAVRALAAATLPLSVLCIYLTISRGGALELCVGLVVFLALVPRRLEAIGTLIVTGAGSAILILAASRNSAVRSGLETPAALHAGSRVLLLAVLVCCGAALLQAALALADFHTERPGVLRFSRRRTLQVAIACCIAAVLAGVALGAPGKLASEWHQFKQPPSTVRNFTESDLFSRLSIVNGDGRYQLWQAALNANATRPLVGIGPGTFQFWWAQHATTQGFVLNAHSLYFETLAETGIIGLALLGGLLLWLALTAVRRSLRAAGSLRVPLAGAAGGLVAFLVAASIDWVWQLAAVAATALILGAVIVSGRDEAPPATVRTERSRTRLPRILVAGLSIPAIIAISIPLAATIEIRRSQAAAAAGQLSAAYSYSRDAERLEPYAGTPRLQAALVLEASGRLGLAASAAAAAARNEPTDWQTWLTLSRIDAERGATRAALAALAKARALNPRSPLFQEAS